MSWTQLKFKKHKGKTLPEVFFCDPGWFFWVFERDIFKDRIVIEAEDLYRKVSYVKIPTFMDEEVVVDYFWTHGNIFVDFEIVPASKPINEEYYECFRDEVIDFTIVYRWNLHDRNGYHIFMRKYKYYRFGAKDFRMSKKDCEDFFEDNDNFTIEIESKNDDIDSSQKCWMKPLFEGSFKIRKR